MSQMSQNYCIVQGCRFPSTHLTKSHKCGKCGRFGHGQMECHNPILIDQLKIKSSSIKFPHSLYCTSLSCPCPWSHSSESHYCSQCQERHLETACPRRCDIMSDPNEIKRVIKEAEQKFGSTPGKIYTTVYSGQGCDWYVKRNGINKPNSLFFMHGDAWGQYGPETGDYGKLQKFCYGYRDIDTGKFLEI
jgi:hypothetical protein